MKPLRQATFHRFDSVADLVALCRERYPGAEVNTANEDGDFLVRVRDGRRYFERLIVHFEGEGCYAVELPGGWSS